MSDLAESGAMAGEEPSIFNWSEQLAERWPADTVAAPSFADRFVVSSAGADPDHLYLAFGKMPNPVWLTEEDRADGLRQCGGVLPITVRGTMVVSRKTAEQIYNALGEQLGRTNSE